VRDGNLYLELVAVRVGDAGERHVGRVVTALQHRAAALIDVVDHLAVVQPVVDVKADVTRPAARALRVEQQADRAVAARDADEGDAFVAKGLPKSKASR
jgi:hypothetical protein